jgi:hypothetical protein
MITVENAKCLILLDPTRTATISLVLFNKQSTLTRTALCTRHLVVKVNNVGIKLNETSARNLALM